jgi:glycosyltransferase involved in cell wall biosynthesis
MRIGIVPALHRRRGGVYQYSLTMLRSLDVLKRSGTCTNEFVIFADPEDSLDLGSLELDSWKVNLLPLPSRKQQALERLSQAVGEGVRSDAWRWMRRKLQTRGFMKTTVPDPDTVQFQPELRRWATGCGVELMLYPVPLERSFESGVPYVMAIHDLQHRLHPEFPEVSADGEWERREYLYRNGCRYATLVLADSEIGKEDILNVYGEYGITPDRVKVLPFLPASYLAEDVPEAEKRRVGEIYDLPEQYLFYPAQYWPHKNHSRVVEALGLLKQEHRLEVPIVLCGTYAGTIREATFKQINSLSRRLHIENQILHIGYVPDDDISALYATAAGLVMPTFFGPTNIPVLEAWALGCPVLTSDIRGIREQVSDAAILVDPKSAEAIADGIYRLLTEDDLRETLVTKGRQRLALYGPADYRSLLFDVLKEAETRVLAGSPSSLSVKIS